MSILGSNSGGEAESPEEILERMETEVIKELEDLQQHMEEIFDSESRLVKGLEEGLPKERIEERISSIEIYIQEDISPEENDLEEKIGELEKREARLKKKGDLGSSHQKLLEVLEDAISKIKDERKRLKQVVKKSEKLLSGEDFSHKEVLQELEDEVQTEGREARILEEEISEIEDKERNIQA